MGEFITEKETERLLELETRYLPIPEPLSSSAGRLITVFRKKPVTMFRNVWETFDLLIDERFNIYTQNELVNMAVQTVIETKSDFDSSLHNVVAGAFSAYKEINLPILREIDDLARELKELEKDDENDED